jgi:hypothetical protein
LGLRPHEFESRILCKLTRENAPSAKFTGGVDSDLGQFLAQLRSQAWQLDLDADGCGERRLARIYDYALRLEDARAHAEYGMLAQLSVISGGIRTFERDLGPVGFIVQVRPASSVAE